MGSLILCHKKKADQPFKLAGVHYKIYTIEELCYGICTNLYLIDYSLMSEQLCEWLEDELELYQLADQLREQMRDHVSLEQFIYFLLDTLSFYSDAELLNIKTVLDKLKDQKEVERQKFKADDLLNNGEYEAAILGYKAILSAKRDETVNAKFYGKIYACLGASYGRLFLYREAARMYATAFQICDDISMAKAYLYACKRYMTAEEYHLLLASADLNKVIDKELVQDMDKTQQKDYEVPSEELLEKWKQSYRHKIS